MKSSKHQAPTSRETSSTKLQGDTLGRSLGFEVWNFSGAWMLELKIVVAKKSKPSAARLKAVKLFLCDVDGVLTDGSIFIGGEREFKRFNIRDGLGLVLARRAGLKIGWVSARPSLATTLRAEELKIHFLVQQNDRLGKAAAIEALLAKERLSWNEVCFVGDDI